MRRFQTSIKTLMQARTDYLQEKGISPIFLSDWDSDYSRIKMPAIQALKPSQPDLQKYYFWTDEEQYRTYIKNYIEQSFHVTLSQDNFAIGSNGTSCLMLALAALRESGKKHALIVTPIYFSTLNLLDELNYDVTIFTLSSEDNFNVDTSTLKTVISKRSIDVLIITNPIFGCGIELNVETIKIIASICNEYNVCFVMDYIYGGMAWDIGKPEYYIFNYPIYEAICLAKYHVFVESISKRVFLNGAKIALLFSSQDLMRRMLRLSVFMVGSMAAQQVSMTPYLYSVQNRAELSNIIFQNASAAKMSYSLIRTIIADTSIDLSTSNCGYFTLMSLPKESNQSDIDYAKSILYKTGVLTTPHSRYLFKQRGKYSFRINLLMEKWKLIDGITEIVTQL